MSASLSKIDSTNQGSTGPSKTTDEGFNGTIGLADVFKNETMNPHKGLMIEVEEPEQPKVDQTEPSSGFWCKVKSFFSFNLSESASTTEISSVTESEETTPIDRIPDIEHPDAPINPHIIKVLKGEEPFSLTEMAKTENPSKIEMKDLTPEQVILLLTLTQLMLDKSSVSEDKATFEANSHVRRGIKKLLEEAQKKTDKAKKSGSIFGYIQLAFACVTAVLAVASGAAVVAPALVPAFFALIPTAATSAAAVGGAMGTIGKTYFDHEGGKAQADSEHIKFEQGILQEAGKASVERMTTGIQDISQLHETLIELSQKRNSLIHESASYLR